MQAQEDFSGGGLHMLQQQQQQACQKRAGLLLGRHVAWGGRRYESWGLLRPRTPRGDGV